MDLIDCFLEKHDLKLVVLAITFSIFGSITTVRLLSRIYRAESDARMAWLFMGGASTGATIWCTHFIAMIAYRPGVEVRYDPETTGLSLVLAILGSAAAFHIATRTGRSSASLGGALFGIAVSVMHYVGMYAFGAHGELKWSYDFVALSAACAILLGALAFNRAKRHGRFIDDVTATFAMVASILLLHFTGMAAMTIVPLVASSGEIASNAGTLVMAIAVGGIGVLVIGTGLATYAVDAKTRIDTCRRTRELLESNVDGMIIVRDEIVWATNIAFAYLVDLGAAKIVGQHVERWLPDITSARTDRLTPLTLVTAEGTEIPTEVTMRIDCDRACPQTIYSIRDLRARIAQERRIAHLARNDSLTGLPNRASFLEWLGRQTGPDSPHSAIALLSIDLDRFKEVNDLHGHAAGDRLLTVIAERMRSTLRADEFVARLGGDEFVALMPVASAGDARDLIDRMRVAVTAPVPLEHSEASCGMSVGVALWPRDATETSALINNADLAMYRAKRSIATDACFYEEEMDTAVRTRRRMVDALRRAIEHDELSLHWQVQQSVKSGEVTGYEALLRWTQADGTVVSPGTFIPIAEQSGLILPIGEWVLRTACRAAARWPVPRKIAVNLSPVQLGHVDLPRLVQKVLIDTGLPASRLELEITETAMIADPVRTIHVLRQLKATGVAIAMDDFGTGYSSLSTLRSFPFDKIKLDRSFMVELDRPQSAAIMRAVLTLGASLSIPVLAEGVETVEQLRFLRAEGCDEAQGYLLGRPTPQPLEEKRIFADGCSL